MVTPRTILLPTDFTGRCDRSRDRAVLLARAWDARLVLLHVLEDDTTIPWDREEAMDRAQAKLESRSEEHTSELQSLMRISYAVFCLKKKKTTQQSYKGTQCQQLLNTEQ